MTWTVKKFDHKSTPSISKRPFFKIEKQQHTHTIAQQITRSADRRACVDCGRLDRQSPIHFHERTVKVHVHGYDCMPRCEISNSCCLCRWRLIWSSIFQISPPPAPAVKIGELAAKSSVNSCMHPWCWEMVNPPLPLPLPLDPSPTAQHHTVVSRTVDLIWYMMHGFTSHCYISWLSGIGKAGIKRMPFNSTSTYFFFLEQFYTSNLKGKSSLKAKKKKALIVSWTKERPSASKRHGARVSERIFFTLKSNACYTYMCGMSEIKR